ncbi:hypothetical protein [Duganella callida]|uniref:Uncharacterized protein n=1 Tax=Duganella callida TaxID=2561932 RepID=A0A4Y9SE36_9BURK|nr:hypothetical protein [Duganella callida]TFW18119.1 hypothetical protein E4L98_19040 [Duganella callida]
MYPLLFPSIRAYTENLLDLYILLGAHTLDAMRSLCALNLQLARGLIAETGTLSQQMMSGGRPLKMMPSLSA